MELTSLATSPKPVSYKKVNMIIMAIDPASKKIGYAYFVDDRLIKYDSLDLSKDTDINSRYKKIYLDLSNRLLTLNPNVVVLEAQKHFLNAKTARVLNEVVGIIKICCLIEYGFCKLEEIHPKTMKKMVTGNGSASKEDVIKYIMKIYPINIKDKITEDMADAIGLGYAYFKRQKCQK